MSLLIRILTNISQASCRMQAMAHVAPNLIGSRLPWAAYLSPDVELLGFDAVQHVCAVRGA